LCYISILLLLAVGRASDMVGRRSTDIVCQGCADIVGQVFTDRVVHGFADIDGGSPMEVHRRSLDPPTKDVAPTKNRNLL
ncbi:hypothetical protein, partial [Acinetobacter baumannii]|uniref:hypothetical protein n=1 Tax=Acinetobacter baumannii TaxID=470 RepID=UPI00241E21D3